MLFIIITLVMGLISAGAGAGQKKETLSFLPENVITTGGSYSNPSTNDIHTIPKSTNDIHNTPLYSTNIPFVIQDPLILDSNVNHFTQAPPSDEKYAHRSNYKVNVVADRHFALDSRHTIKNDVININMDRSILSFQPDTILATTITLVIDTDLSHPLSTMNILQEANTKDLTLVYVDSDSMARYSRYKTHVVLPRASKSDPLIVTIQVEPTTFLECFHNVEFSIATNYVPATHPKNNDAKASFVYSPGIKWNAKAARSGGSASSTRKHWNAASVIDLYKYDNNGVKLDLSCSKCYFVFDTTLNATISASLSEGVEYIGGSFQGSIDSVIQISVDAEYHQLFKDSFNLFEFKTAPITFTIGIIPFTIVPQINVDFDYSLKIDAVYTNTFGASLYAASGEYGYAYSKDFNPPGWEPIHTPSIWNFSYTPLQINLQNLVGDIIFTPSLVPSISIGFSSGGVLNYGNITLNIPVVVNSSIGLETPKCSQNASIPLELDALIYVSADLAADIDIALNLHFWTKHLFTSSDDWDLGYLLDPTSIFDFCAPKIWSSRASNDSEDSPSCNSCVETKFSSVDTFNYNLPAMDPLTQICTGYLEFTPSETMSFAFSSDFTSGLDEIVTTLAFPDACCNSLNDSTDFFDPYVYLLANTTMYQYIEMFLYKDQPLLFKVEGYSSSGDCSNVQIEILVNKSTDCYVFFDSVTGSDTTGNGEVDNPFQTLDMLGVQKCIDGAGLSTTYVYLTDGTYFLDNFEPFEETLFLGSGNSADSVVLECASPTSSLLKLTNSQSGGVQYFYDLTIQNCQAPILFSEADYASIFFETVNIRNNSHCLIHAPDHTVGYLSLISSTITDNTLLPEALGFISAQSGVYNFTVTHSTIRDNSFGNPFAIIDNTNAAQTLNFGMDNTIFSRNSIVCDSGNSSDFNTFVSFIGSDFSVSYSVFAYNIISGGNCQSSLLYFDGLDSFIFDQYSTNIISNGDDNSETDDFRFKYIFHLTDSPSISISDSFISDNTADKAIFMISGSTAAFQDSQLLNNLLAKPEATATSTATVEEPSALFCNQSTLNFDYVNNTLRGSVWHSAKGTPSSQDSPPNLVCNQCQGCVECSQCGICGQCTSSGCDFAPDSAQLCGDDYSCSADHSYSCISKTLEPKQTPKKPSLVDQLSPLELVLIGFFGVIVLAGIVWTLKRKRRRSKGSETTPFLSADVDYVELSQEQGV